MSADLHDVRWKITGLAYCYIEAEHRVSGKDQSEIAREILHEWAERKHRALIEPQKLLAVEGIVGNGREAKNGGGNDGN